MVKALILAHHRRYTGTMNFYAISAGLPDVEELPRLISQNTYRLALLLLSIAAGRVMCLNEQVIASP